MRKKYRKKQRKQIKIINYLNGTERVKLMRKRQSEFLNKELEEKIIIKCDGTIERKKEREAENANEKDDEKNQARTSEIERNEERERASVNDLSLSLSLSQREVICQTIGINFHLSRHQHPKCLF